jgi:hypothetical protein
MDAIHVLSSKWNWSFKPTIVYKQQSAEAWLADYKPLIPLPIDSVELFWRVYDAVPTLMSLDFGNIYALFRDDILPSWEHPMNEDGYSVLLYMNKLIPNEFTAQLYQHALLMTISNAFDFSSILNGCTIERKTGGNKISFWISSEADSSPEAQKRVAESIIRTMSFISPDEVIFADENGRVEWRDAKFSGFKYAVRCMSHKKRALEPVVTRTSTRNSSRSSSRGSTRHSSRSTYGTDRQGGNHQGGNHQGGNRQGGNHQGGNHQGGNRQGGNRQGGNRQGADQSKHYQRKDTSKEMSHTSQSRHENHETPAEQSERGPTNTPNPWSGSRNHQTGRMVGP